MNANLAAYEDFDQVYTKLSNYWTTIDKLGPVLLASKNLLELAMMNE
ncbi:unnamed protein product, partial [Rotaria magnacalcarata]